MILILDPFVRVHLVHRAHLEANAKFNELLTWSLFDFFLFYSEQSKTSLR